MQRALRPSEKVRSVLGLVTEAFAREAPGDVYECEEHLCPGGHPGTCSDGRDNESRKQCGGSLLFVAFVIELGPPLRRGEGEEEEEAEHRSQQAA